MSTQIDRQEGAGATPLADIVDPSAEELRASFRWMLLARRLDERTWQLVRQGKGHFAVPCWGHEAVGAGYALALRRGHDYIAPHYRDMAAMLAIGFTPRDVMANYFARAADPCSRGRQPFVHWGSQRLRIITLQPASIACPISSVVRTTSTHNRCRSPSNLLYPVLLTVLLPTACRA